MKTMFAVGTNKKPEFTREVRDGCVVLTPVFRTLHVEVSTTTEPAPKGAA